MNFEVKRITTPTGEEKHELRIWNFGPKREERKRRFDSKRDLFSALDDFRREDETLRNPAPVEEKPELTFGEIHQDFLKRQAGSFSPGWKKNIEGYWRELEKEIASLPPASLSVDRLKAIEQKFLSKGNSQKTAGLKIGFIKSVLNFAFEMDLIQENRAAKFRIKKAPPSEIQFWEREDAEDFLAYAAKKYPFGSPNRWIYVVYLLSVNAGLRAGEVWALKPRCLKRSLGVMHIDQQYDRVIRDFRPPKGKGPRNVPMNQLILDELDAIIDQKRIGRQQIIFPNAKGKPICHDNFYDRVFCGEFGKDPLWEGPKIVFHGLRHTAATLMLDSGIDVKTVQEILGHKELSTTMKYVHLIGGKVKAAGEKFAVRPSVPKLRAVR